MGTQLIEVMRQIERARKVDRAVLIQAIEAALISASRKNHGTAQDIRVEFNSVTGDLLAFLKKKVVSEVHEPWNEISLEEAQRINPKLQEGDSVELTMRPSDFGRIAAQTAKQVMLQRVRESERNAIFEEFKKRQGEMVNGVVLRLEHKNLVIDLGDTEAILPFREQVSRESYKSGERIKAYIMDVRRTSRSPQVVLSRSHPGLIRKLFEMEVPEVADGVVEIRTIAREAGARSKVAVCSKDKNVDPVGACVGIKGSRIQAIVREIHGEKIDVILFSENIETLLSAALQPAKISKVEISAEKNHAIVIVNDDQLALAIGKNGQNVRLASKLIGWKIDIISMTKNQQEMRKKAEEAFMRTAPALNKIPGITPKLAERLQAAGYMTVGDFLNVSFEKLTAIPGIGQRTAEKIVASIKDYLPQPAAKEERTAAELFAKFSDLDDNKVEKSRELKAGELFAGLDRAVEQEAISAETGRSQHETVQKQDVHESPGDSEEEGEKK
ncbi:transcription termination/antitermination protein NusA [candidate division FCPU426 bacterium]|nr:transcription termination/antitermination protein NusA [candidate division FCPU426 bacterium]